MTRRFAFFVEGYTERAFVKRAITEFFNKGQYRIEIKEIRGGSSVPLYIESISIDGSEDSLFYFLVMDCGSDSTVKSYILEQRDSLLKKGYEKLIGIRDVYPEFKRDDVDKLKRNLYYGIPQKDMPIKMILCVMEIESWFIAESGHYTLIDENLNHELVGSVLGCSPVLVDPESIESPAEMLKSIYQLVKKTYTKDQKHIDRTIDALDFVNLFENVKVRTESLNEFIYEIEQCSM